MSFLKRASSETKRITLGGDESAFITVRADVSKRDYNKLISFLPQSFDASKGFRAAEAAEFAAGLFDTLIVGWSLTDDAGNAVPVSRDAYDDLTKEAADAVDEALLGHFNGVTPTQEERTKSKGRSA